MGTDLETMTLKVRGLDVINSSLSITPNIKLIHTRVSQFQETA